ncbi:hypothetical protein AEGHOMDF_1588 [Methylobacterium soli]|nr:hypothetical protein AEGHOMDF_1588 [Methylobacterium soli]
MVGLDLEKFAAMRHRTDAAGIREGPRRAVTLHGAVVPASLPELVEDIEVLFGIVVAPVVRGQAAAALPAMGAVEIAGDDVPADPAPRQVVEGREAPGEGVGRLVVDIDRDAEAQMLGGRRHGGDEQGRLVDGKLHGLPGGHIDAAAVNVVDADDVGDEEPVEQAALQKLGLLDPVIERVVIRRPVSRMGPESVVDVADAVHVERVQTDLLTGRHPGCPCRDHQRALSRRIAASPTNCTRQTSAIRIAMTAVITVVSKRW